MKEEIKSEKERKRRETDSLVKRWASEMSHILTKTRERDWDKLKINNCSSERGRKSSLLNFQEGVRDGDGEFALCVFLYYVFAAVLFVLRNKQTALALVAMVSITGP